MTVRSVAAGVVLFSLCLGTVRAQYPEWQHSGAVCILTTPDGADLPATAAETNFPLLVRLNKEWFDFSQAQPQGEDIRLADSAGAPLAYQIEEWDATQGVASIWVRIPLVKGNTRQEIRLHWGKADAASESSGAAVFNAENGYVAVMHLSNPTNPVRDEVGTLSPSDAGTTAAPGTIGAGRRFDVGKGIGCGEKIEGLPTGSDPSTTEAWLRPERVNAIAIGWGNEHGQGKVTMRVNSPPHLRMECYFSGADVAGRSRISLAEWIHVAHTYRKGESRIYLNGVLDGVTATEGAPLAIKSPARMYLGGWYNNYQFIGDIDEVRISKVVRSADWVKLGYENQKPLQTLVGGLVRPGSAFDVSPATATVDEGRSVSFTAQAGGADKTYWIVKRGDAQTVVAADTYAYTFDAGRITADTAYVLQFKAVYPDGVKTRDIPITIKDTIPEPVFTLRAPAEWNGRDPIELAPAIRNLEAMKAKGAGDLRCVWSVEGGAVIKKILPDRLVLQRSQCSNVITVSAAIDNGGAPATQSVTIRVREPKRDPWAQRVPEKDEKPEDNQFYARDDRDEGTLFFNGTLDQPADAVFLKVYADEKPFKALTQRPAADGTYAFTVKLKPGLIRYKAEFGTRTGRNETVMQTATNLVCGDAFLINGQSNALATDTGEESPREINEWIRSYGGPTGRGDGGNWVRDRVNEAGRAGLSRPNLWCNPVWKGRQEHKAELGYWGMELAKRLLASQKVPICIIQAAVGGTRIDEHQPSPDDHADLGTIYGRMLWRVRQARLTHGIRAVIWHQGESDQGSDGPTGGYGWETYQQYFTDMSAAWKDDMPNIRRYYVFQIWPNACSMGGGQGSGDRLREAQRTLPRLYSNMSIMSTLGIEPPGGCHYPLAGWAEFARLIQPLIERDFYGSAPAGTLTPPDLRRAYFTSAGKDEIALEFDQPVIWHDGLAREFYLDGRAGEVASGLAAGNTITLTLKATTSADKITYLKERDWSQDRLVLGTNGIAALTFCDVAIEPPKDE